MVNTGFMIGGIVLAGALYILGGDLFGGKHKAIVFFKDKPHIVKAALSKDGKQYIFKFNKMKHIVSTDDNEYFVSKNKTLTIWEINNHVVFPVKKQEHTFKVKDTNTQLQMVMALEQAESKVNESWWDKNKEAVVGITLIAAGVAVYVLSLKFAGDIDPSNVNACIQVASDIKNSSLTTENNINKLVQYISNNAIPK